MNTKDQIEDTTIDTLSGWKERFGLSLKKNNDEDLLLDLIELRVYLDKNGFQFSDPDAKQAWEEVIRPQN